MHAFLCTVGSHGDVHPYLALARALVARGHRATLCTNPYFEPLAREFGVDFVPLGERVELADAARTPGAMSPFFGPVKLIRRLLLPHLDDATRQLTEHLRTLRPTCAVLHPIALGGPSACELAGVPWVGVALAPVSWWNPQDRAAMGPFDPAHPSLVRTRVVQSLARVALRVLVDRPLNRTRLGLGLAPARDQFITLNSGGVINLGLWSAAFRPTTPGDPPQGRIVGFPWFDTLRKPDTLREPDALREPDTLPPSLDPVLERFLAEGDGPLVFTMGTAAVHVAGRFFHAAADAARALNRRAILLCGKAEYAPRDLAPSVLAVAYAPFSSVFPRASAIIHHCGIGTTAQALRAGRPQLACPMAHDQFDNAARLSRLGVARVLHHRRATAACLARELAHLLDDPDRAPGYARAASESAARIAGDDGALGAVLALERAFAT
jgi:UDP:flavonoid glycosyltransferase YjiC (YdhE family)